MRAPERRGIVLVVVSAVSFGCVAVLGKLIALEGMRVPETLFWRWLIAFVALAPFVARRLHLLAAAPKRVVLGGVAVGALGYAGTSGLYFLALPHVQAALASFLLFLSPVFVALLSGVLLGERLGARGLVALALAVAGLLLMSLAPGIHAETAGVVFALASAVLYALTIVSGRSLVSRADPLTLAWLGMGGAALAFALASLASGDLRPPPTPAAWGLVATLAVLGTALSVGTFYVALPLVGAPRASLLSTLEPVSTILVAFVVLQEPFTPVQLAGGALVLLAVALVSRSAPEAPEAPG